MPLTPLNWGDVAKSPQIEKYKGSEDVSHIINIDTSLIFAATLMFHDDIGTYYATNCKAEVDNLGLPKLRYIICKIVYSGDMSNYGTPIQMLYFPMGQKGYEELMLKDQILRNQGKPGGLADADLLCKCDNAQYQNMSYEVIGDCKWRQDQNLAAQVAHLRAEYEKMIEASVARTITVEKFYELTKLTAGQSAPSLGVPSGPSNIQISSSQAPPQIAAQPQPTAQAAPIQDSVSVSSSDAALLTESPQPHQSRVVEVDTGDHATEEALDSLFPPEKEEGNG